MPNPVFCLIQPFSLSFHYHFYANISPPSSFFEFLPYFSFILPLLYTHCTNVSTLIYANVCKYASRIKKAASASFWHIILQQISSFCLFPACMRQIIILFYGLSTETFLCGELHMVADHMCILVFISVYFVFHHQVHRTQFKCLRQGKDCRILSDILFLRVFQRLFYGRSCL